MSKPENINDEHLEFLDDLRDSGVTNMFGAGVYIQEEFGVSSTEASKQWDG